MCGILGYVKGNKEVSESMLREAMIEMFIACQARGTDATGYGYIDEEADEIVVRKEPIRASEFVRFLDKVPFGKVNIFLGHTRSATHGDPKNNTNNHPIVSKDSQMMIIHNGVVDTDKKLARDGECDSELILRLIELRMDILDGIRYAEECYWGTSAYALLAKEFKNRLYLVRSGNPIHLAYDQEQDMIYFASTEDIIKKGFQDVRVHLGFFSQKLSKTHLMYQGMDDNSIVSVTRTQKGFKLVQSSFKKKGRLFIGGKSNSSFGDYGYLYGRKDGDSPFVAHSED